MDTNNTIKLHKEICRLVPERRLKESFEVLSILLSDLLSGEMNNEYEKLYTAYKNMLSYFIDKVEDPEQEKVFIKLMQSVLNLADRAEQDILSRSSGWNTYQLKQQAEKEQISSGKTIVETVDDLLFKIKIYELPAVNTNVFLPESKDHKDLITYMFNHFWLTDYYGDAEASLINLILTGNKFKWYESCIFISAITLSLLRIWQSEKLIHLISFYNSGKEQIMERGLVGIVLALHQHDCRYRISQEIQDAIDRLMIDTKFKKYCKIVLYQLTLSRETEKITKKLNDEIIPKVVKIKPKLKEDISIEDLLNLDLLEDKNPDWTKKFNESEEIFKSMEEITKLQSEGADIYMSTFEHMKNFDFFNEFQNWFLPYYPENENLYNAFDDEIVGPATFDILHVLSKTAYICNSDKYSFINNIRFLTVAQKKLMIKIFRIEFEGMMLLGDDPADNTPDNKAKTNITQYIQDLYRFFKLSPQKKEFEDIFNNISNIYESMLFKITCNQTEDKTMFADYFINKDFYEDALSFYLELLNDTPDDSQLYEKTGYCYQKQANYGEALNYYRKAEMIDCKPWTLKKIGVCLRHLGRIEEALEYYLRVADAEPENMNITMIIGNCYLHLKDYNNALKYYFKFEYAAPENTRVIKLISFCYLSMGDSAKASRYYGKLHPEDTDARDLVNMGHLALLKGDRKEAADNYIQSITQKHLSRDNFLQILNEDIKWLSPLGLKDNDLLLIADYVLFNTGQNKDKATD